MVTLFSEGRINGKILEGTYVLNRDGIKKEYAFDELREYYIRRAIDYLKMDGDHGRQLLSNRVSLDNVQKLSDDVKEVDLHPKEFDGLLDSLDIGYGELNQADRDRFLVQVAINQGTV
jgi:hypothetical protein